MRLNNLKWFDFITQLGIGVNEEPYVYGKGYESGYKMNLLTIAKSEQLRSRLLKLGIEQYAQTSWESHCKDDNVRLRASSSVDSAVLGKLNKGNKFTVIGHTYSFVSLPDGTRGRWVNIVIGDKKYWIWSSYVWEYER